MLQEIVTVYNTFAAAEDMVRRLTESEEDSWSYTLAAFGDMWAIEVHDEDGYLLGLL